MACLACSWITECNVSNHGSRTFCACLALPARLPGRRIRSSKLTCLVRLVGLLHPACLLACLACSCLPLPACLSAFVFAYVFFPLQFRGSITRSLRCPPALRPWEQQLSSSGLRLAMSTKSTHTMHRVHQVNCIPFNFIFLDYRIVIAMFRFSLWALLGSAEAVGDETSLMQGLKPLQDLKRRTTNMPCLISWNRRKACSGTEKQKMLSLLLGPPWMKSWILFSQQLAMQVP